MRLTHRGVGRAALRRLAFLFQDGMVLATTLRGMDAIDLLAPSLERAEPLDRLCPTLTDTGLAHLRVGLRTLAQVGWIASGPALAPEDITIDWTTAGRAVAAHHDSYLGLGGYLATFLDNEPDAWQRPWDDARLARFADLLDAAEARWELDELAAPLRDAVVAHLDGALAAPALLWLEATGGLDGTDGPLLPDGEAGEHVARLLRVLGWLADDGAWTEDGATGLDFVVHLGLVGSYLPMFGRLPELYGGAISGARTHPVDGREWHVQRELNIRASTAAHGRYFGDADAMIAQVFDREPLADQPRFVLDTGCGDASWLARVHALVRDRTLRGRHLPEHPLPMVGADYSQAAVQRARRTLAEAGADALVLLGDVSEPDALAHDLAAHGLAMEDALHLHAFVDHDRGYGGAHAPATAAGLSSGAYIAESGHALDPADVEADLAAHLARWAPHVARHGLIVLEAHCVAPQVAARHQGALHSVAFDAYHGLSRQYPVERRAFISALRRAGLRQAATGERRYPTTRPFVAVSLNHLLSGGADDLIPGCRSDPPRQDTWQPAGAVDRRDGRALHELLYERGDLRHPRLWSSAATSVLVTRATAVLEERLATLSAGSVLRVLDYGTGTALAAIELLKACRETGLEDRLERAGVTLELHLADIPSSWFAYGFDVVRACSWTRCHSLVGADGRFRPLLEVTGGERMDVVMSSMVFHLIPPRALRRVARGLADVTAPGGRLLWNAPDLGVAGPYAVLFHDPNRALRAHWKALLQGVIVPQTRLQRDALTAALARAADGSVPLIDDDRAGRRILPRPHTAAEVADALSVAFAGEVTTGTYEIADQETVDTLLVPSNQEEYLPEIEDEALRAGLVEELMRTVVLPAMHAGPAGTALGYNVHWTFGDFRALEA
ncbi:MAG TPA: class I SAM-dependent methyltransferase [Solirubrobacteraceae bacterium]|nr:class I SAM-dependent methyltransferase [Solirubrobacteraceae bacterium]